MILGGTSCAQNQPVSVKIQSFLGDPHRHAIERKRAATDDLCTDAGGISAVGHVNGVVWAAAPAARVMRTSEERIVLPLLLVIKRARLVTCCFGFKACTEIISDIRRGRLGPGPEAVDHCGITVCDAGWPGVR